MLIQLIYANVILIFEFSILVTVNKKVFLLKIHQQKNENTKRF